MHLRHNKDTEKQNDKNLKKFNYKYLLSSKIKFDCCHFAFNPNFTILFAGYFYNQMIKIFGLNSKFKQIQTFKIGYIKNLNYLKKSDQLITLQSYNKNIDIRNFGKNSIQRVQNSLSYITILECITINEDGDLLMSGTRDRNIIVWKKDHLGWNCFQIIDVQEIVSCLSLNPSQTKLIANGYACTKKIFVIELQPNQQWMLASIIQIENDVCNLQFVSDNQFAFLVYRSKILEIYSYDQEKKQFNKNQQLNLFTMDDYIVNTYVEFKRRKNILIVTKDTCIYFFRINQNEKYELEQQIIHRRTARPIYGKLADDAQYLVTWDTQSERIQIKRLFAFE